MKSELPQNHFRVAVWSVPATLLILAPGLSDPINLPKLLILASCAFVSLVMFAINNFGFNNRLPNRLSIFHYLLTSLAVISLISGLISTPNHSRLWFGAPGRNNGLIFYISLIAISFVILSTPIGIVEKKYVIRLLRFSGAIFGLYCLLQLFNLDPVNWNLSFNRVIGSLGNPNFSSSMLGLSSVFCLYQFFFPGMPNSTRTSNTKFQLVLGLSFAGLSWYTESIQGAFIIAFGLLFIFLIRLRNSNLSMSFFYSLSLLGLLVSLILFYSLLGNGPFGKYISQYTLNLRLTYAYYGLKAIFENPILGLGVDSYNMAFRLHRSQEFVSKFGIQLNADNPHSTPIQIGVSFGLVAAMLYICIQILTLKKALSISLKKRDGKDEMRVICVIWILLFLQSLLSIEIIGLAVMQWVLGALIIGSLRSGPKPLVASPNSSRIDSRVWASPVIFITITLCLIPFSLISREDAAYERMKTRAVSNSSAPETVLEDFKKLSFYTLSEPTKSAVLLQVLYSAGLQDQVESVVSSVFKVNPKNPIALEIEAIHQETKGDIIGAISTREKLRELDPQNYRYELTLARLLSKLRDTKRLTLSLQRIYDLAPADSNEMIEARKIAKENNL